MAPDEWEEGAAPSSHDAGVDLLLDVFPSALLVGANDYNERASSIRYAATRQLANQQQQQQQHRSLLNVER